MQQAARQKKGVYSVLKTAEEFFADPQISESFDRVIAVMSVHHFVNPDVVFKGIFRSLRPGGVLFLVTTLNNGFPIFKSAEKPVSQSFERERESQFSFLTNLNAIVSQQEFSFQLSLTKSKLYELLRCRFISMLEHFSDDQIEEVIRVWEWRIQRFERWWPYQQRAYPACDKSREKSRLTKPSLYNRTQVSD